MTLTTLWPILSLLANFVLALILFSLRSAIRIAIFELREFLADKYATKDYVDQQVKLADRIDTGFAKVHTMLRARETAQQSSAVGR